MARGRMINQTIDFDPEFNALSVTAQLMYLRTLAFLDRDGLIIGHPRALLAKVAPLLDLSQGDMIDIIIEWVAQGLVIRYAIKVGDVLFFKGFAKNQSGMHYDRESPSRFDPPPGWTHGPKGLVKMESVLTPPVVQDDSRSDAGDPPAEPIDDSLSNSGLTPAEVRQESGGTPTQIEVKDQDQLEIEDQLEENTEDADATPATPDVWSEFLVAFCWACYGHKELSALTEKQKGALASEAKRIYGKGYTIDDLRNWFRDKWQKDWRWTKDNKHERPTPSDVRSMIPAIREEEPEISNYANGNGRYSVDIPGVVAIPASPRNMPPLPPPMAHDDPWQVGLDELSRTLPPRAVELLEGSRLVANGELAGVPFYQVVVVARQDSADWLKRQVEPAIRKKVASVVGHRVEIDIVAAQGEPA